MRHDTPSPKDEENNSTRRNKMTPRGNTNEINKLKKLEKNIDRLCYHYNQSIERRDHKEMTDLLQEIIIRSIIYYNMNQEQVKEMADKAEEFIRKTLKEIE